MIVVADTSPLNYLVLIGEIELLPKLYEKVLLPYEVHRELQHDRTPNPVRTWAASLPGWCEVRSVSPVTDAELSALDAGERDAIQLALDSGLDTLLIDELGGRRAALRRHLHVTGTIAVLEKAARMGLTDFRESLQRLEATSFRISPSIREQFLRRNP